MLTLSRRSTLLGLPAIDLGRFGRAVLDCCLWPLIAGGHIRSLASSTRRPISFRIDDPNSYEAELLFLLNDFQKRLWLTRSLLLFVRGLVLIAAVFAGGFVLRNLGWSIANGAPIVVAAIVALWTVFVITRQRISYADAARVIDRRLGLNERTGTAVELIRTRRPGVLSKLQIHDATIRVRPLETRSTIRLPLPSAEIRAVATMAVLVAAVVGVGYLKALLAPPPTDDGALAIAPVADVAPESIAVAPEDFRPSTLDDQGMVTGVSSSEALSQLRAELAHQNLSEAEIASRLANAEQALREEAVKGQAGEQVLSEVATALQDNSSTAEAARAIRQGDYATAAQKLTELGQQSEQLSGRAREDLADRLSTAAGRVEQNNPELAGKMRQAAEALEAGDPNAIEQALADLGKGITEAKESTEAVVPPGGQSPAQQAAARNQEDMSMEMAGELSGDGAGQDFAFADPARPQGGDLGTGEQGPGRPGSASNPGDITGAVSPQQIASQGAGAGAGEGQPTGEEGDRIEAEGKVLNIEGRPSDSAPGTIEDDPDRVPLVASTDGSSASSGAAAPTAPTVDASNARGESNFVPLDKRQIIRDYFSVDER